MLLDQRALLFQGLGFRVQGSGFRGLGFRSSGSRTLRFKGLGSRVYGLKRFRGDLNVGHALNTAPIQEQLHNTYDMSYSLGSLQVILGITCVVL